MLLSVIAMLALYSGMAYLHQSVIESETARSISSPLHPRYVYSVFVICALYFLLARTPAIVKKPISTSMILTSTAWLSYMLLEMLLNSGSHLREFEFQAEFLIMIPIFIVVFSRLENPSIIFDLARVILLLECALHVIVFLRPRTFPMFMEFGRVSGLWGNANAAALFIAGSLPLAVTGVRPKFQLAIGLATFLGVLATLSRGGLLVWLVLFILTILLGSGKSSGSSRVQRIFYTSIAGVCIAFGALVANSGFMTWLAVATGNISARLSTIKDSAAAERLYVVRLGWQKFTERPVVGNGVGYTFYWDYLAGPHNTFILVLVEQGILGLLLFVAWLFGLLSIGGTAGVFAVAFFVSAGLFSHNLLDAQYGFLVALYWLSARAEKPTEMPSARGAEASGLPSRGPGSSPIAVGSARSRPTTAT